MRSCRLQSQKDKHIITKLKEKTKTDNKASITALMSAFGRAFHAENEKHPVFTDFLAKELMSPEEYAAVQGYVLGGTQFFEPEINPVESDTKELLRGWV